MDSTELINRREIGKRYMKEVIPYLFTYPGETYKVPKFRQSGMGFSNRKSSIKKMHVSVKNLRFENSAFDPKEKEFYHFTSLKSLFSILNYRKLRLYNISSFNDPFELETFLEGLPISKEKIIKIKSDSFCFSMNSTKIMASEIELLQWRLYGDNGSGVAIKLKFNIQTSHNSHFLLGKVKYGSKDHSDFLKAHSRFVKDTGYDIGFTNCLQVPSLLTKSQYLAPENEVRLVVYPIFYQDSEPFYSGSKIISSNIYSDFSNISGVCKYLEIPFISDEPINLPDIEIKEILIGYKYTNSPTYNSLVDSISELLNKWVHDKLISELPLIRLCPLGKYFK